jgi:hypothetical protein
LPPPAAASKGSAGTSSNTTRARKLVRRDMRRSSKNGVWDKGTASTIHASWMAVKEQGRRGASVQASRTLRQHPQGCGLPAGFLPRPSLRRRCRLYHVPGTGASNQPHEGAIDEDEGAIAHGPAGALQAADVLVPLKRIGRRQAIVATVYDVHDRSFWRQRHWAVVAISRPQCRHHCLLSAPNKVSRCAGVNAAMAVRISRMVMILSMGHWT